MTVGPLDHYPRCRRRKRGNLDETRGPRPPTGEDRGRVGLGMGDGVRVQVGMCPGSSKGRIWVPSETESRSVSRSGSVSGLVPVLDHTPGYGHDPGPSLGP